MNAHVPIPSFTSVEMTPDGEVLVPKVIREAAGLVPGSPVVIGINDCGEAVILTRMQAKRRRESVEERRIRIRKALDDLPGRFSTGQPTDEIMEELRGDRDR